MAALGVSFCTVQILDGDHAVTVLMQSLVDRPTRHPHVTGADHVVQAG